MAGELGYTVPIPSTGAQVRKAPRLQSQRRAQLGWRPPGRETEKQETLTRRKGRIKTKAEPSAETFHVSLFDSIGLFVFPLSTKRTLSPPNTSFCLPAP